MITTWGADPAFNMGLDEALTSTDAACVTLRFYTWRPDTLSLGYFQRVADVPGCERAGVLVRRITGGGAIHHVNELTFSISGPATHALYSGPIAASYARVHDALCTALATFGVDAQMRKKRALASDRTSTGMCFHHSTDLDIVWNDRKGVGSAQRRTKGRVLHHGSIKLGSSELEGEIATLRALAPAVTVHEVAEAIKQSFRAAFAIDFETSVPNEAERTAARELGKRYVSADFVHLR